MNRVVVLIPVYRNQSGLDRTLDSLLGQAYDRFDVVVVDDGSPDRLVACLQLCGHTSVLVMRLERNQGIARVELGLRYILANGYSYVARLDAGDTAAPQRFEEQVRFLDVNQDCAVSLRS